MQNDFDILFLARLFPKELYDEIYKKSNNVMEDAQNALHWNIIEGLDKYSATPVKIVNLIPVGSYPRKYKECLIKTSMFSHCPGAFDINVGYFNLCYIKYILLKYTILPYLKKWANQDTGKQKVLILYSLEDAFLYGVKYIKKINPLIKCCVIVADLPSFINLSQKKSKLMSWYTAYNVENTKMKIKYIDSFVLLTKHMKDYLHIDKPFIVMEGISTDAFQDVDIKPGPVENRIILYTGTMHERFGIMHLLKAFSMIKMDNYRLVICGVGDSVNKVKEMSQVDPRIIYKGQLTRKEVLELQLQATVLVNPRQNNEEFTKYSFPSKNMEYLSSGRPVVAYKLDGIPDEYDKFIQYVENDSIETLSEKLIEICERSDEDLMGLGQQGKQFVLTRKNKYVQAERILDMLKNMGDKRNV